MITKTSIFYLLFIIVIWGSSFVLRLLPLGLIYKPLPTETILIILVWCFIYVIGFLFAGTSPRAFRHLALEVTNSTKFRKANISILFLSTIALLGALLLFYEFAIARGYGLSTPVSMIRVLEVNALADGRKGSIIGGLARFMLPAILAAWPLFIIMNHRIHRKTFFLLIFSTGFLIWIQAMYEGGRFFLVSLLFVSLFTLSWPMPGSVWLSPKKAILIFAPSSCVVIYCLHVFLDRYSESTSLADSFSLFAAYFDITLSDFGRSLISGPLGQLAFSVYMLLLYVTHPFSELSSLLSSNAGLLGFGGYQIPQLLQVLGAFGSSLDIRHLNEALQRPGVYSTLIGANYIDFGIIGVPISAYLYGFLTSRSLRHYSANPTSVAGAYAPFLFMISCFALLFPIVTTVWPAFLWILILPYLP